MNQTQQDGNGNRREAKAPLLVLKKLDKRFGATHALKAVDLEFEAGAGPAIFGANGGRKSTLTKMLTRGHVCSRGEGYWEGKPVEFPPPPAAVAHGINPLHH